MKYKHYAPSQPVTLIEGGITKQMSLSDNTSKKIAVIGPKSIEPLISEQMTFIPLGRDIADIKVLIMICMMLYE